MTEILSCSPTMDLSVFTPILDKSYQRVKEWFSQMSDEEFDCLLTGMLVGLIIAVVAIVVGVAAGIRQRQREELRTHEKTFLTWEER